MKFNDLHIPGEQHQVPTRREFIQNDDSMKHHMGKHIDILHISQYDIVYDYTTIHYLYEPFTHEVEEK